MGEFLTQALCLAARHAMQQSLQQRRRRSQERCLKYLRLGGAIHRSEHRAVELGNLFEGDSPLAKLLGQRWIVCGQIAENPPACRRIAGGQDSSDGLGPGGPAAIDGELLQPPRLQRLLGFAERFGIRIVQIDQPADHFDLRGRG